MLRLPLTAIVAALVTSGALASLSGPTAAFWVACGSFVIGVVLGASGAVYGARRWR